MKRLILNHRRVVLFLVVILLTYGMSAISLAQNSNVGDILSPDESRNVVATNRGDGSWVIESVTPGDMTLTIEGVNIPDPNLRAAIETALGKAAGAPITVADMKTLTSLFARNANISNLTGLEHATNLTDLGLDQNSISDVSALSGLTNLWRLTLTTNSISDVSPLSGLTNLSRLKFFENSISDISALSGLTNLTLLNLGYNSISDLSPLVANTGLGSGDTVNVQNNPLNTESISAHIPALRQRGVEVLGYAPPPVSGPAVNIPDSNLRAAIETALGKAAGAPITVADMETLTSLTARDANISNLTGLEHATNLTRLALFNNRVSDLSPISGLTNLTWLDLNTNHVSDLSPVSGLTNLTGLTLYNNRLSDLSPLVSNTGLGAGETVDVRENSLNTASINTHIPTLQQRGVTVLFDAPQTVNIPDPNLRAAIETALGKAAGAPITVTDMETLTSLTARDANISNLTGLEHATNLTDLDLIRNSISNLSPLSGLTNLTGLHLGSNRISDLSPISGLTNLGGLDLGHNSISDVSPLSGLTNLVALILQSNSISNVAPLSGLANLRQLLLSENSVSDVSPLFGLTNLTWLYLNNNSISDLSSLVSNTGLGSGDEVDARGNPLNTASISAHIPALQRRGVTVLFDPPQTVNIPDPNLRAAIETALGKAAGATITVADMETLTSLTARDANISNLTGLEHATNLGSLDLIGNSISNLWPLSRLFNLTDLGLDQNSISDVSPLSGLTNLWRLTLSSNSVSGVSPLSGLTHLTVLELVENSVSDLSPLSGLTNLTWLNLENNSISDLAPLVSNTGLGAGATVYARENPLNTASINSHIPALQRRGVTVHFDAIAVEEVNIPDPNLRAAIETALGKAAGAPITVADMETLTYLGAANANISNLTGLEHAINLTELILSSNSISDLSPISGLTNLTTLILSSNSISDLSPISGLTNLTGLDLFNNSISDLSPISGLTNLTELYLQNNSISDLSPISGLTTLTRLVLFDNSISDISVVSALTNLTTLDLFNNSISDLSPISGLTNLTTLDLFNNSISDLSPISGLTNLTWLGLFNNSISDLSPISGLTNLTELYLQNNSISDLSPLVSNTGLERGDSVWVEGNPLSSQSIQTHIPTLQRRRVTVHFDAIAVEEVNIPDPNLRRAVEAALGKAAGAPITVADMETLTSIIALDANISNLTGLEHATNLTDLDLIGNSISNLSPLLSLSNLTDLGLTQNSISDVSALSGLTNLWRLELNSNSISDVSPLSGLTNLSRLKLYENSISDVSPLSGLTNLTWLNLAGNSISDVSALAGLTNLTGLSIYDNTISDLSPLVANTGLGSGEEVDATENPLNTASINSHIPALQQRGVTVFFDPPQTVNIPDPNLRAAIEGELGKAAGAPITVADMETLTRLTARDANISNLTGLEHAANLTWLALYNSPADDIMDDDIMYTAPTHDDMMDDDMKDIAAISALDLSPLAGLINLTELFLAGNSISNITPLSGLTNLTDLGLDQNSISDVSALSGLTNLIWLNLRYNSVSDVSALAGLTNLTGLNIYRNTISDLSPLVANTGLGSGEEVDARGNPLNTASINTHIPALQQRGVEVLFDTSPPVNIPDPNLRAAIETALGKAAGAPITVADMGTLTSLTARDANISDLTGLEGATNLTGLVLGGNSITDLSPLVANTGLGSGDTVNVRTNPLNRASIQTHIPALQSRGVTVEFDNLTPTHHLKVSGDNQRAIPGTTLEQPFVVEVRDQLDKPLSGVQVTFLVTQGGGTLSATSATTNTAGRAESILTLGPNPGTNTVTVSVAGIQDGQTFTAEGVRIPLAFWIITGFDQNGLVGEALAAPFVVEVRGQSGGPFPDAEVTFTVISGGGTLSVTSATTDTDGRAESILTLGPNPGTNTVTVSVAGIEEERIITAIAEYALGTGISFAFSKTPIHLGDSFTLDVRADNVTDLAGWQFDIVFDRAALEAIEVSEGDFLKSDGGSTFFQSGQTNNATGKITGLIAGRTSAGGVSGSGSLLKVEFKAKSVGETELALENLLLGSATGGNIPVEPPSVSITVEEQFLTGDANRDGVVNILDLIIVAQRLGTRQPPDSPIDINGDGFVNIFDLTLIAQGIGAAAPGVSTNHMVQSWIAEGRLADDGSLIFQEGIRNLETLLASLLPDESALLPNYPNPFNPETWIPYQLSEAGPVSLSIYDTTGALIRSLSLGIQPAGFYNSRERAAHWDGRNDAGEHVASGIYFYQLRTPAFQQTRRLVIVK